MFRALSRKLVIFNFRGRIHSVSRMLYRILDIRSGVECIFGNRFTRPRLKYADNSTLFVFYNHKYYVVRLELSKHGSCARHESAYFVMNHDDIEKLIGAGLNESQVCLLDEIIQCNNKHLKIEIRCYEGQGYDINIECRQNKRRTKLRLTLADGSVQEGTPKDIFESVVKGLGAKNVFDWQEHGTTKQLIVSDQPTKNHTREIEDGYYILTAQCSAPNRKKLLEHLSEGFSLGLRVDVFEE